MVCANYKAGKCTLCDGETFFFPECPANENFDSSGGDDIEDDDEEPVFDELVVKCPTCGQMFKVNPDRVVNKENLS